MSGLRKLTTSALRLVNSASEVKKEVVQDLALLLASLGSELLPKDGSSGAWELALEDDVGDIDPGRPSTDNCRI